MITFGWAMTEERCVLQLAHNVVQLCPAQTGSGYRGCRLHSAPPRSLTGVAHVVLCAAYHTVMPA